VDVLRGDQDLDLIEKPLKACLELLKELRSFPVRGRDDFDLDNVLDDIHVAVFPSPLIRSGLRTDRPRSENGDQLFTNLFDFVSFDFSAVVVLQRQVNSYFFMLREESNPFTRKCNRPSFSMLSAHPLKKAFLLQLVHQALVDVFADIGIELGFR
jgi:hypothetical protein